MNIDELLQSVVRDTVGAGGSLTAFRPELTLVATIVVVLLAKIALPQWRMSSFYLAVFGLIGAMAVAFPWNWILPHPFSFPFSWLSAAPTSGIQPGESIFTGMLASDSFSIGMRGLLLLFALLFATFAQMTGFSDQDDMTEFYVLLLGSLLGMCVMIAANHVLTVMLGVEMASVPCYVLAGMQRHRPRASEAAMKYAVFGAASAAVMLYGLSLLAGTLGSAHLPTMTARLAELFQQPGGLGAERTAVLMLAGLMLTVGVAFKLSAVPFHFWAPDVFEGAAAEVAAFLSVASKAAALGLLVRLAGGFAFPADLYFLLPTEASPRLQFDMGAAVAALAPARKFIVAIVATLAAITCTYGNLAAYGQTNMKRLLAYSTIAHAGYMMMPVAAAIALVGPSVAECNAARFAVGALVVYVVVYLFMNLAAFAMVAFLRGSVQSEDIEDYAGMIHTSPGLTMCMALVMFSLVGLPPLAGFSAKFVAFYALVQAKLWALLCIGALNTVLSLFYYLRVVRVMVFSPEPLYHEPAEIPITSMIGSYCALLTLPVVALFFMLGSLLNWGAAAAFTLFR